MAKPSHQCKSPVRRGRHEENLLTWYTLYYQKYMDIPDHTGVCTFGLGLFHWFGPRCAKFLLFLVNLVNFILTLKPAAKGLTTLYKQG